MTYPEWEQMRNWSRLRHRYCPLIEADMPSFMGLPLASAPQDIEGADAVIIGARVVEKLSRRDGVELYAWPFLPASRARRS